MNNKTKIIVPAALSIVFLMIGVFLLRAYSTRKAEYTGIVEAAEQELAAAQSERDAFSMDTAEGAEYWQSVVKEVLADAETEVEALQAKNAALDESIASAQKEIDALESNEDTAYYKQVYDTLSDAMAKVTGYIENGIEKPEDETENAEGGTEEQPAQETPAEGTAG